MTLCLTEEEKEWIVTEAFNWHVAEGCPFDLAETIQRKLDLLKPHNYEPCINRREFVAKNDRYGIQKIELPTDDRHITIMVFNWKDRFRTLENSTIRRLLLEDIKPEDRYFAFVDINDGSCVGYGVLKDVSEKCLEVGFEIKKDKQGVGIGGSCVPLFINYLRETIDYKLVAKVYSDNYASRKILKKVGAIQVGSEESDYSIFLKSAQAQFDSGTDKSAKDIAEAPYIIIFQL